MPIDSIEHPTFEARFPLLKKSLFGQGADGCVESWSLASDFLTPTDAWDLTFVDVDIDPVWYEMQPVEVYVDGRLQLIGRCDKSRRGSKDGSTVQLWGRDYLADMTTCNIDPLLTIKKDMTLQNALLAAMAPAGITSIDSPLDRNNERTGGTGGKDIKLTQKQVTDYKPRDMDSIFSWSNRLSARESYTIQCANRREAVVLQGPTYSGKPVGKIAAYKDPAKKIGNNVIDSWADRDFSEIPSYMIGAAQSGRAKERRTKSSKIYDMADIVSHLGFTELKQMFAACVAKGRWVPDPAQVRDSAQLGYLYRLRHYRDKESRSPAQLNGACARMRAEALKQTLVYEAKLKGSRDPNTGKTWAIDTLVDVDDDRARVHETLWIASRGMSVQRRQGCETQIKCWRPHTFQIQPED